MFKILGFRAAVHGGVALLLALGNVPLLAETGAQRFHRAYYLEKSGADPAEACKLFDQAADDASLEPALRSEARTRAESCKEELACKDFASLMPPNVMAFVEIKRPGDQLGKLLNQLGLLGGETGEPANRDLVKAGKYLAVSPKLVRELLGVRGMAAAVTGFNPLKQMPTGVLIFHPGDVDALRGLIETGLPAGATAVEPIQGFRTYHIENQVFATVTHRLVVVSTERGPIDEVVRRLRGQETKSLASSARVADALKDREHALLYFLVDAKTVMPYATGLAAMAGGANREVALAKALLDPDSLQSVVGKLGVNDAGLFLDVSVRLDKNHRNLVFNFFRAATLNTDTLKCIPEGVAAFSVVAINDSMSRFAATPPRPEGEAPVVTALDLGREFFANLTNFAVFLLPPPASESDGSAARESGGLPIPDVAAVMSVNDPARTDAIWQQFLGIAAMAGGAPSLEGAVSKLDGVNVKSFKMPQGVQVHLAVLEKDVLVAPSRRAMERAIQAKRSNRSVLNDSAFAPALSRLTGAAASAIFVHPARCAQVAATLPGGKEGLKEAEPFLPLLTNTVAAAIFDYSEDRLGLSVTLTGIPRVDGLVAQLIQQGQPDRSARRDRSESPPSKPEARSTKSPEQDAPPANARTLRKSFESLAGKGDFAEAGQVAEALVKKLADDAQDLNNFAWELLTEKPFVGHFTAIAQRAAERANELTRHQSWAYLDTLALARFENGDVSGAIELQKKAIELAAERNRDELRQRLSRFEAARKAKSSGTD